MGFVVSPWDSIESELILMMMEFVSHKQIRAHCLLMCQAFIFIAWRLSYQIVLYKLLATNASFLDKRKWFTFKSNWNLMNIIYCCFLKKTENSTLLDDKTISRELFSFHSLHKFFLCLSFHVIDEKIYECSTEAYREL